MYKQMNNNQLDYILYDVLYNLSSVLKTFPCETLTREIDQARALIQNKRLKVAIVGEFRRGKSSLINALLGMPILPVDIEPTTAAINRVTYGINPKAIIHFKDGNTSEVPISELSNYVTKLTPTSSKIAEKIQEAEIQYPTELCSNHIDIIDTPGLNDTENMTAVTESMLDDINIAIVAIKSTMPYSETECLWVTKLLSLPNLTHIVFVVTCMDLVRKKDVEKLLTYTRQRVVEKTLECVRSKYSDRQELILKAERIFNEKNGILYPVSAILALDSFNNGDYELLSESNIPSLKKDLLTTMNAQQQMLGVYAVEELINRVKSWISSVTVDDHRRELSKNVRALTIADESTKAYFAERSTLIEHTMQVISSELQQHLSVKLSAETLENSIRKVYIKCLSTVVIHANTNMSQAITVAMQLAEQETITTVLPSLKDELLKSVNATIVRNMNMFLSLRDKKLSFEENNELMVACNIPSSAVLKSMVVKKLQEGINLDLPQFSLQIPSVLFNQNVMQSLITPYIRMYIQKYRQAWQAALPEYTQNWYSIILQTETKELCNKFTNLIYSHIGAVTEKITYLEEQYQNAITMVNQENQKMEQLKENLLS